MSVNARSTAAAAVSAGPVAFLGPVGTFGELAARELAGGAPLVPMTSHREVLRNVEDATVARGVVALENSREGVVPGCLVGLVHDTTDCVIAGEHLLPVRFALMRRPGDESSLKGVVGHAMALSQCARFIDSHGLQVLEAPSNAAACGELVVGALDGWGALGPETAAELHGLDAVHSSVGDDPDAMTRFALIGHACPPPTGADRTALVIAPSVTEVGSLARVILEFNLRQINLLAVKSIPSRGVLGTDAFLFECPGHILDFPLQQIVLSLSRQGVGVRFLGSYPQDPARVKTPPTLEMPAGTLAGMIGRVRRAPNARSPLNRS